MGNVHCNHAYYVLKLKNNPENVQKMKQQFFCSQDEWVKKEKGRVGKSCDVT